MIIPITEGIEVVRNNMAALTGVNVNVGMPEDLEPALYLFPYQLREVLSSRTQNNPTIETEPQLNEVFNVKALLIPSPSNNYTALSKGLDALISNAVLESNERVHRVTVESITTEDLTGLFISSGVTYRLSIPFEIASSRR
ncbi:MAG: hypothetical protein KJO03_05520 [Gammaproteobacteria bacterium]|nr:hypothetical protein [Gammaproteobacteria bacterium]